MQSIRKESVAVVAAGLAVVVALAAAFAGRGEAAAQVRPTNTSPPSISAPTAVGQVLTIDHGVWRGTAPISFAVQWQRCDQGGNGCASIPSATKDTYAVATADVGRTLRAQVTGSNAEGPVTATSAPTAVVQAGGTGCSTSQQPQQSVNVADVSAPAQLLVDRQSANPAIVTRTTRSLTLRFHVTACDGRPVQGALVYATPTPFQQFAGAETATAADGWVTITLQRQRLFPASPAQQLLAVFVRARKPGEPLLGGISSRRLVSFRVRLGG
jgi:hypothetical protein